MGKLLKMIGVIFIVVLMVGCNADKKIESVSINTSFETVYEVGSIEPDWTKAIEIKNGKIEKLIIDKTEVNMNKVGTYSVNYSYDDKQFRLDIRIADHTLPTITLIGNDVINIALGETYVEQGAVVTDNYDSGISDHLVITGTVNDVPGTYEILYKVVDQSGNERKVTRIVNVVYDALYYIEDEHLKDAIREAMGKSNEVVTLEEAEGLLYLDASYRDIKSIRGLELFRNLLVLNLDGNNIKELTILDTLVTNGAFSEIVYEQPNISLNDNDFDLSPLGDNYQIIEKIYQSNIAISFMDLNIIFNIDDEIQIGEVINGELNVNQLEDTYTLKISERSNVQIDLKSEEDLLLMISNEDGTLYTTSEDHDLKVTLEPGKYTIEVTHNPYLNIIPVTNIVDYEVNIQPVFMMDKNIVKFTNVHLESIIRESLGIYNRDLTQNDIDQIIVLQINDDIDITSLKEIDKLTNLEVLYIDQPLIHNISEVSKLTKLKALIINSEVIDITPIANMTTLETLYIESGSVLYDDISAIIKLTNLKTLFLFNINNADLSPLVGLINLDYLYLEGKLKDLNPLITLEDNGAFSRNHIYKKYNQPEIYIESESLDFSSGSSANNVINQLYQKDVIVSVENHQNIVDDVPNDFDKAAFVTLNQNITGELNYNNDKDVFTFDIIKESLIHFNFKNNHHFNITVYDINQNEIEHNDQLFGSMYTNIMQPGKYYLEVTKKDDFITTNYIIGIKSLELDNGDDYVEFKDANIEQAVRVSLNKQIGYITNNHLKLIESLTINDVEVSDLKGIEQLVQLKKLTLTNVNLKDITILSELMYLKELDLSYNTEIEDYSPLIGMIQLKSLNVSNSQLTNITRFKNMTFLEYLYIENNLLDYAQFNQYNETYKLLELAGVDVDIYDIPPTDDYANESSNAKEIEVGQDLIGKVNYKDDIDFSKIHLKEASIMSFVSNINTIVIEVFDESMVLVSNENCSYLLLPDIYYIKVSNSYSTSYQIDVNKINVESYGEVIFNDLQLERAIRNELNGYTGKLTTKHLELITSLSAAYFSITDLTNIEKLTNLEDLYLNNNSITDITKLSKLLKLKNLTIVNNNIVYNTLNKQTLTILHNQGTTIDVYYDVMNDDHSDILNSTATIIDIKKTTYGTINDSNDIDYFKFTLLEEMAINMHVFGDNSVWASLHDSSYTVIHHEEVILQPGTYYIEVASNEESDYYIQFDTISTVGGALVSITDSNLVAAIKEQLSYNGNLNDKHLQILTKLYVSNRNITSIEGIEKIANLQELYLDNNPINNIMKLSGLNQLRYVNIDFTNVDLTTINNKTTYELLLDRGVFVSNDKIGNTLETSLDISLVQGRTTINSQIDHVDDIDVFKFIVSSAGYYTIYTTSIIDTYGNVKNINGTTYLDDDSGDNQNFKIESYLTVGTYYILINGYGIEDLGKYTLLIEK